MPHYRWFLCCLLFCLVAPSAVAAPKGDDEITPYQAAGNAWYGMYVAALDGALPEDHHPAVDETLALLDTAWVQQLIEDAPLNAAKEKPGRRTPFQNKYKVPKIEELSRGLAALQGLEEAIQQGDPGKSPGLESILDDIEAVLVICRVLEEQVDKLPAGRHEAAMSSIRNLR